MIEEDVKQTRCTTCDAEHPYKGGQAPKRRKKESQPTLPTPSAAHAAEHLDDEQQEGEAAAPPSLVAVEARDDVVDDIDAVADSGAADAPEVAPVRDIEDGPVHRPLIRATLPRPEGQKDVRTPPDFTVRQSGGRGGNNPATGNFRGGGNARMRSRGGHGGNGHRPHGSPGGGRFAGARPGQGGQGQGRGQGGNFRPSQQPRHGGGGRKRSR
ncbi:MAG TPA: hypothetical protein VFJ02_11900 [Vicinamibacterales bacterium]|nr:hypothetical protein [Vicinamibacterales bacterium]